MGKKLDSNKCSQLVVIINGSPSKEFGVERGLRKEILIFAFFFV
jgi:hypothetical protein